MPAEFIIDPEGMIRFVHYGGSMSDIPEPTELLEAIEKIKG
jgi:peroxiredoxin Q/BCP